MSVSETVLVTGGSGYLGGWCLVELLRRGHTVRTTVRSPEREPPVRAAVSALVDPGDRLGFVTADLTEDAGWDAALADCDRVLHVASPFPPRQPSNPDELVVPARDGTLRVLGAALKAGARRIVVTSSVAAVAGSRNRADAPLDEHDWTDLESEKISPYVRSKTVAERAAWEFMRERGEEKKLAVVNPGAILGPVIGEDRSFSLELVERLIDGKMPGLPRIGFSFVDVRDVVDLELRAMTAPEAGGERYIAVSDFRWVEEIAAALRAELDPEAAAKVPTRRLPDILVRLAGRFDPGIRSIVPQLGRRVELSNAKAVSSLGWRPRPATESAVDTARSMLERAAAAA